MKISECMKENRFAPIRPRPSERNNKVQLLNNNTQNSVGHAIIAMFSECVNTVHVRYVCVLCSIRAHSQ